jgi:signal transduction histidine kinase
MTPTSLRNAREPLMIVCVYMALYVFTDWISMVQVLPDTRITLWNPPPACSLALILMKGLKFAPALFPAAVLSDSLIGGFSIGVLPALVVNMIIAVGYSAVAIALRPFAGPTTGFQSMRDLIGFLGVVSVGVLSVATSTSGALVLLNVISPDRFVTAARNFWIGDITGIVGLFPVLMTAPSAWERWRKLPAVTSLADCALFSLMLVLALWCVFWLAGSSAFHTFYLLLLPMIWIGVRHGLPWCAIAILIEQLALISVFVVRDYSMPEFVDFQLVSLAIAITGLVVGTVVTERQRTELRLRDHQAELDRMARLTTAGALGSAIVHEISQPLATIATYAHACRVSLTATPQKPDFLRETLAKVELESLRAGKIAERLRDFVSKGEMQLVPLDLAEKTHKVLSVLADEAQSHGVEIYVQERSPLMIAADRLQMEQVMLNLIRNAIEAAAENAGWQKRVCIRLRRSDNVVQVDVEDNGPGVNPEIAAHLFEPFMTGKPRGMGLGLMLSRQIVQSHGGDLWCDPAVVTGARFSFWLPALEAKPHAR